MLPCLSLRMLQFVAMKGHSVGDAFHNEHNYQYEESIGPIGSLRLTGSLYWSSLSPFSCVCVYICMLLCIHLDSYVNLTTKCVYLYLIFGFVSSARFCH